MSIPSSRRNVKVEITLSNNTVLTGDLIVIGNDRLSDSLNKLDQVFKKELIVLSTKTNNYISINKQHIIKVLEINDPEYKPQYHLRTAVENVRVKITLSNGPIEGNLLLKGKGRVSDRLNKIFGVDFIIFWDTEKQYHMLNKQHIISLEEFDLNIT